MTLMMRYPFSFFAVCIALVWGLYAWQPWLNRLEQRDHRGRTALLQVAEANDLARVEQYLTAGADPHARDHCQWTALMRAAQHGNLAMLERLYAAGARVDVMDKAGFSALMVAAGHNHVEAVNWLAQQGADVNIKEPALGWTALIWARQEGYAEVVQALLALGAEH